MIPTPRPSLRLWLALALLVVVVGVWALIGAIHPLVASRIHAAAEARGLDAEWTSLSLELPVRVSFRGLLLRSTARGDTVCAAESLSISLAPLSLLTGTPRVTALSLARARFVRNAQRRPLTEIVPPPDAESPRNDRPASPRVVRAARSLVNTLLLPAREMPHITVHDVAIDGLAEVAPDAASARRGGRGARRVPIEAVSRNAHLRWLELKPGGRGVTLSAVGSIDLDEHVPFTVDFTYDRDDRLSGRAQLEIPNAAKHGPEALELAIEGHVVQDRGAGVVRIAEPARATLGGLPFTIAGSVSRDGPALSLRLEADSLSERRVRSGIPRPMLGPLSEVAVFGSWDYRFGFDLDLAKLADVDFRADVIPHGLALDSARTTLRIRGLSQPFVAEIHLPHDRIVPRDLSPANPHFHPLERIDSLLIKAVVTNEDGGFYRHRGFNTGAVKDAIADNIRAGAYRRGAGTITMQLARNLYLGHERTLARKAQEVVLAWVLEHLSGVSKQRLLEIYLNIIEWGPDIHGADEAAAYYFGTSADRLSLEQSLFLTILIPSPTRWRSRFEPDGRLGDAARAQMHFIGNAMIAKGWLTAGTLPETAALDVTLTGPAREVLFPASSDSLAAGLRDALRIRR